jgi:hypothetical protein
MKKQELDQVLRAAGRINGEKQFIIVGSQALHGKHPDVADDIIMSAEVDLLAAKTPERTEWLHRCVIESATRSPATFEPAEIPALAGSDGSPRW